MIYTPTPNGQKFFEKDFKRIMVIEVELPSGTRINPHEIKSFLCRVDDVMDFTYEPCDNKLVFFINLPSTKFNKKVSFEWELERLSWVNMWTPIQTRVYDYLQYETELVQLVPIQFEPNSIGDRYVDDVLENFPYKKFHMANEKGNVCVTRG